MIDNTYVALHRQLRTQLRWQQALLGQASDLPDPDVVHHWALQLETYRRVERALEAGDLGSLTRLRPALERALG